MSTIARRAATLEDLYRVEGKAELIRGQLVRFMATGRKPNRVAFNIVRGLDDYARQTGRGEAYTGSMGFAVGPLASERQSFSPDASYSFGPFPDNPMRFLACAPVFAAEVCSENDYTAAAEAAMAAKRADYFEAGTQVVWDVDPIGEVVRKYGPEALDQPTVFVRGQEADAEPAVPGWRIAVDRVFG